MKKRKASVRRRRSKSDAKKTDVGAAGLFPNLRKKRGKNRGIIRSAAIKRGK